MNLVEKLAGYINAGRPVVYICGSDVEAIDSEIVKALKDTDQSEIEEYNHAQGRVDFKTKVPLSSLAEAGLALPPNVRLAAYLDTFLVDDLVSRIIVLKDVHNELSDPVVCARLKMIAWRLSNVDGYAVQVIIVSSRKMISLELEKQVTVLEQTPPTSKEIEDILEAYCAQCEIEKLNSSEADALVLALRGLNRSEIQQVLNYVQTQTHGSLLARDAIPLILEEKKQVIQKSNMLEPVDVAYGDALRIGGLGKLVSYLKLKSEVFKDLAGARRFGVSIPKGILIVGMPGCGKSLAAKECARLFKVPLVRLDVGRLLGRYVGESEENLRRALLQAEAAMPCVLWIDEIEKAFAGVGRDESGVTTRLFGQFLTWMQEKDDKDSTVYVVATANDISRIPPEFLRRGRFDEIFSVGLPSHEERKKIFDIHLTKYKPTWRQLHIDLEHLVDETERDGYSGADIESIVKTALEKAYRRHRKDAKADLTQQDILDAIRETPPMRETMKDKIQTLEESLKKFHVVSASN